MRARLLSKRATAAWLLVVLAVSGCQFAGDAAPLTPSPPGPAHPAPFALAIEHIELAPMANEGMLTGSEADVPRAAAEQAVEATRAALERYLDAQFAAPATRFGEAGARALLRPGLFDTLTPEQRHALGHLDLPVTGVATGPATGRATVLFDRGAAYAVSIDYEVRLTVYFAPDDEGRPVVQHGTVLFVAPSWGVESFELTLDAPPPPPPPPPSPSAGATGAAGSVEGQAGP
jgi:hypothetical protein